MKSGVPFDVAFSLPDEAMMAYAIILGQQDGNMWDWNAMQWRRQET